MLKAASQFVLSTRRRFRDRVRGRMRDGNTRSQPAFAATRRNRRPPRHLRDDSRTGASVTGANDDARTHQGHQTGSRSAIVPMPRRCRTATHRVNPAGYSVALCNKVADALKRDLSLSSLAVEWVAVGAASRISNRIASISSAPLTKSRWRTARKRRSRYRSSRAASPRSFAPMRRQPLQRALEERRPPYAPLWRGTPPPTLDHRTYSALVGSDDDRRAEVAHRRHASDRERRTGRQLRRWYRGGPEGRTDVLFGDRAQLYKPCSEARRRRTCVCSSRRYTFAALALALPRNNDDFRLAVDRALTRCTETRSSASCTRTPSVHRTPTRSLSSGTSAYRPRCRSASPW